jgi:hypothetical protein
VAQRAIGSAVNILRKKAGEATISEMFLLLVAIMVVPGTSLPRPTSKPAYYADRLGEPIHPVTEPIDLTGRNSMIVHTVDGALQIVYHRITSLSYSPLAVSASGPAGLTFHRLLTIGFNTESGVHHNLVVQLNPKNPGETVKTITARTGLKLGEPPRN